MGQKTNPPVVDPRAGQKMRSIREKFEWTQAEVAQAIGLSEDYYGDLERGERMPRREVVSKFLELFPLEREEWVEFLSFYLRPPSDASSSGIKVAMLEEDQDADDLPPLVQRIYKEGRQPLRRISVIDDRATILMWQQKIFRFGGIPEIFIFTGVVKDEQDHYNIPPGDRLAAELIQERLRPLHIPSRFDHCKTDDLPKNPEGDLVLICGPANNTLSAQMNDQFVKGTWFNGFYFYQVENSGESETQEGKKKVPPVGWTTRFHRMPHEPGIVFDGFPYPKLRDGRAQDFGIIYIGPNPLNPDKWLVSAAGLGSVATYGAALAFTEPASLELLACGLTDKYRYCSALIRYRFADEQRPKVGRLASIAVVKGTIPPPI